MAKNAIAKLWNLVLRSDSTRYSKPPITPPTLSAVVNSSSQITVSASGATSGLGSISTYLWYRNGQLLSPTPSASPLVATGLAAATQYSFTAVAVDSAGNRSAESAAAVATTNASADTTAPTVPGNLTVSVLTSSSLRVVWTPSTDSGGSGLAGYKLERSPNGTSNWTQVAQQVGTTFDDTGLASGTLYYYRVRAYDNAANHSAFTSNASGTTANGGAPTNVIFDSGWSGDGGDFVDGAIVYINRAAADMNWPTDPRALLWIPGQSSFAADPAYSKAFATMVARNNCAVFTGSAPPGSVGCLRQSWPFTPEANHAFFQNDPIWSFSTGQTYVQADRMFDATWQFVYNAKSYRVWRPQYGAPDCFALVASNSGAMTVEGFTAVDDAMNPRGNHFITCNVTPNAWAKEEFVFKDSSDNQFDGILRFYRNGGRAHDEAIGWKTQNSTGEPGFGTKGIGYLPQYSNPASTGMNAGDKHDHMCNIFISDSIERIVIANELTFTQQTMNGSNDPGVFREVQLPVINSGSSSRVGILIRKGRHAALGGSGLAMWHYPKNGGAPRRICRWP